MRTLLYLFSQLIQIATRLATRITLMLIGCGVRLLYWSVRVYGWGRVVSVLGALVVSIWLNVTVFSSNGWIGFEQLCFSVPLSTVIIWGVGRVMVALLGGWGRGVLLQLQARRTIMRIVPSNGIPLSNPAGRTRIQPPPESGVFWEQILRWENLMQSWRRVEANGGAAGRRGNAGSFRGGSGTPIAPINRATLDMAIPSSRATGCRSAEAIWREATTGNL